MADIRTSDLPEITTLVDTDIIQVSQDQGGGLYDSKHIQVSNLKSEVADVSFYNEGSLTYYVSVTGNDSNDGLSVGSAFETVNKAITAARGIINAPSGSLTIQIGSGTFPVSTPISNLPHGTIIRGDGITGAILSLSDFSIDSDYNTAKTQDEAMLRARYNTILEFTGTPGIVAGEGEHIIIKNGLLLVGNGTNEGLSAYAGGSIFVNARSDSAGAAVFNFYRGFTGARSAGLLLDRAWTCYPADRGISLQRNSTLIMNAGGSIRSGENVVQTESTVTLNQSEIYRTVGDAALTVIDNSDATLQSVKMLLPGGQRSLNVTRLSHAKIKDSVGEPNLHTPLPAGGPSQFDPGSSQGIRSVNSSRISILDPIVTGSSILANDYSRVSLEVEDPGTSYDPPFGVISSQNSLIGQSNGNVSPAVNGTLLTTIDMTNSGANDLNNIDITWQSAWDSYDYVRLVVTDWRVSNVGQFAWALSPDGGSTWTSLTGGRETSGPTNYSPGPLDGAINCDSFLNVKGATKNMVHNFFNVSQSANPDSTHLLGGSAYAYSGTTLSNQVWFGTWSGWFTGGDGLNGYMLRFTHEVGNFTSGTLKIIGYNYP